MWSPSGEKRERKKGQSREVKEATRERQYSALLPDKTPSDAIERAGSLWRCVVAPLDYDALL